MTPPAKNRALQY